MKRSLKMIAACMLVLIAGTALMCSCAEPTETQDVTVTVEVLATETAGFATEMELSDGKTNYVFIRIPNASEIFKVGDKVEVVYEDIVYLTTGYMVGTYNTMANIMYVNSYKIISEN